MDCRTARAELSALLDRETVDDPDALDAHLRDCADCHTWRATADAIGELARSRFADAPDLTVPVLEAVATENDARRRELAAVRRSRRRILRVAVGVAAVAQLILAIPALLTATGITDVTAVHVSREMASFDIAVAVGFLLAAFRPERARAFVPVAGVLAICLAGTAGIDLADGVTGIADETGHLVAVVQAGLLWALGRYQPAPDPAAKPVAT